MTKTRQIHNILVCECSKSANCAKPHLRLNLDFFTSRFSMLQKLTDQRLSQRAIYAPGEHEHVRGLLHRTNKR